MTAIPTRRTTGGAAGRRAWALLTPVLVAAGLLVLWQLAIIVFQIKPFTLPGPIAVWDGFIARPAVFLGFALNTLAEAVTGFAAGALFGILIAVLVFRFRFATRVALLYSSALIAIPIVAVVPLVAVFAGLTPATRIIVVAIATTPVIFNFAINGLRSTPSDLIELFRSNASGPLRNVVSLYLPRSLPYLISGSKIALPAAFSIAIIAEFFGGELTTLGTFIKSSAVQTRVADVWGAAFVAFVLAGLLYAGVALIERLVSHSPAPHR